MSFDRPEGLWLLALGVPILVFHFYKGRIRRMAVPTLLFWEQVLVEEERRTALKRLRHYASLLLNLVALFVLTSAVAGPNVEGLTRKPARYALLADGTASMGALEADGRPRIEHALERGRGFARSLGFGDQISFHDYSGARAPMTSDHDAFARKLAAPAPAGRVDLRERVLAALVAGEDVTVILLTDRVPEGVEDLLKSGRLRVARTGAPLENTGWTAGVPVRRAGEPRMVLSLTLSSFAASKVERSERLLFRGREIARRAVALEAGAQAGREWVLDPARFPGEKLEEGGLIEVALEPRDAFPADDVASFVLAPLLPPSVIVFHPGTPDRLLMIALETLRAGGRVGAEIGQATADRYAAVRPGLGEGWIVVFDRVAPPGPLGAGGTLILGAPGGPAVEQPAIVDWDREAAPNDQVDYAGLLVRRSRILDGPALVRAAEGPVATWSSKGGQAVVEFGFSVAESDIGARTTLLHLLHNVVDWASWRGCRAFRPQLRLGEPLRPERRPWIDEGEILAEQSERLERLPVRKGRAEGALAPGPGFVHLSAAGRTESVAVNLFDAEESDLRERPAAASGRPLPPPAPWHARVPCAALAVAAVLALLLVEGWLFHRGFI